ncbi:tyrosine-type recombinase/integrase [Kribbella sp. VKM Ac-2568]|uniref:tyrosine-type recombinase/integrase n=1 Tax=Kribbella sp. VKM Ac-2568 TaxID=2512219 RepID=UPI003519EEC1
MITGASAGIGRSCVPADWTPRELRHSFVSLLSSSGVPIEDISRLVGHVSTNVTEKVYRHELRPVMRRGVARSRAARRSGSAASDSGREWSATESASQSQSSRAVAIADA